MPYKKTIFTILIVFTLIIAGFFVFKLSINNDNSLPLNLEKAIARDVTQYISATGTLRAKDQISIGSIIPGKVETIFVEDNDPVKKNQVLAILDDGVGNSAVKLTQAALNEAKEKLGYQAKTYYRQQELYKSGQLSQSNFDLSTKDYLVAKEIVQQLKYKLEIETKKYENLSIKSPDDGIVIAKKVDLGQMITSQFQATTLFEIAKNLHEMEAYVDVDEADVGMVKVGQEALFSVDAFPKKIFSSKVLRIRYLAKIVDNVVTYATVLDVKNPKMLLRPGMTTNVDIKVKQDLNTFSVPNKAFRIGRMKLEELALKHNLSLQPLPQVQKNKSKSDSLWIFQDNQMKEIEVLLGANDGKHTSVKSGIDVRTDVITEILDLKRDNPLLKGAFGAPMGGIGRSQK
jgi:HlyD family secretion protein